MAVLLHLPAVTSVRHLHTVADLMVALHLHLHIVLGAHLPTAAIVARCPCRRMAEAAVAGLQFRPTVGAGRHLTAVAADPCLCHRTVVAVTPVVDSVVAVARADSAVEVVATYPQEEAGIAGIMVMAEVARTTKLMSEKLSANAECRFRAAFFF